MHESVVFRNMSQDDEAFIFSSWLRSYWDSAPSLQHISKTSFFAFHKPLAEKALKYASTSIACSKEDQDVILGYAVGKCSQKAAVVHYLYIKESFRDEGLGTELLEDLIGAELFKDSTKKKIVTHLTHHNAFMHMFRKHGFEYIPYLF